MTILYIGNMLLPHGGSESVIETLTPRLAEYFDIKAFSSKKNKVFRLIEMLGATIFFSRKAKVVLIDSYSSPMAFVYTIAVSQLCRLLNLPYIPILHGGDFPNRLHCWPKICHMVFLHAWINAAPSAYLQAAFKEKGFKTILIPNAIELANYPFKLRNTSSPNLLWVRSFDSIYNPQMAIHILNLISKSIPDARLCMVGPDKDGSLENCKELAKKLGVLKKVQFTGLLSKADWIKLSKNYNIFINTTNFDNTPVSVIEAMALGLPVVSTNVGGIPYLLKNEVDGLLVNPNDIEEMANQIIRILNNRDLNIKLSINARKKVEIFDLAKIKCLWVELLSKINN